MRRQLALTLTFMLVSISGTLHAAAEPAFFPEAIEVPKVSGGSPNDETWKILLNEPGSIVNESAIAIQRGFVNPETGKEQYKYCTDSTDPICDFNNAKYSISGNTLLSICESATEENCIEGLYIGSTSSAPVRADFLRTATNLSQAKFIEGGGFTERSDINYYGGAGPSLWQDPVTKLTYAVTVKVSLFYNRFQKKFVATSMDSQVFPYEEVAVSYDPNSKNATVQNQVNKVCIFIESGKCGEAQIFEDGIRLGLKVRLTKEIGGWFRGRMAEPQIVVKNFSSKNNELYFEANPVEIPRFHAMRKFTEFTDYEKKLRAGGSGGTPGGLATGAMADEPEGMRLLDNYRAELKDTAVGTTKMWRVSSISSGDGGKCLSDTSKVLGMVSTNAMAFDGGAPAFKSGFLNYKVAGFHYMPDGKEFQGVYDLLITSETARCLYKFNKAPVSATITVAGDGDRSVATTVVSEKNGWLRLAAYGFTFSEKTIKVKLTQKKTSITCVSISNPRLTKKVTNYSPSCPSGFKNK